MRDFRSGLIAAAALLVAVSGVAHAATLTDGGFEAQGLASNISGSYCYGGAGSSGENNCGAGAWTFSTLVPGQVGDGIISQSTGGSPLNSSAWGAPIANDNSSYFAFVQINGSFSQTFQATQSGTVSLDWIDAARSNSGGTETYTVSVNNMLVGTYAPTNSAFAPVSSKPFSLIAGDFYTVTFQGVDPNLTDRTAFIDNVSISPLPSTWTMLIAGFVGLGYFAYRGTKTRAGAIAAA
jgi:hypothetical protein